MSPGGERARTARVHFVEGFFTQDVERASAAGKAAAAAARAKYEADGVPVSSLQRCDPEGRDGTRLADCLKVYVPPPVGRFGIVFRLTVSDGRAQLDYVAFGVRHRPPQSRAPTVYHLAHYRLHGSPT